MNVNRKNRSVLLDMARRRAAPGSGSVFGGVHEERAEYGWTEELPDLGEVKYAIVGGLATARYMPQRMTLDTDLLILSEELEQAEDRLKAAGCERLGTLTIGGSSWRLPHGRPLDLIALAGAWVGEALNAVVPDSKHRPFVSLPFLVLMKIESGRLQDLADISRMLGCADHQAVEDVRTVIGRYRPQDMDDLESMHQLGKLEYEPDEGG